MKTMILKIKQRKLKTSEEAAKIIRKIEQVVKSQNKNIIWFEYQQGKNFEKLKDNAKFNDMIRIFGYSKSTIILKKNIVKLIKNHP